MLRFMYGSHRCLRAVRVGILMNLSQNLCAQVVGVRDVYSTHGANGRVNLHRQRKGAKIV